MIPGEYILQQDDIIANAGRPTTTIVVVNTGDRPVQIGSHFHFFEVNRQLQFNRQAAYGMRLNIPAGTAVRFEPGEEKEVHLVTYGGAQKVYGFNNLVNGDISEENKERSVQNALNDHFKNQSV
jgi:urease subunit beta